MHRIPSLASCITLVWTLSAVVPAHAQPGWVLSHQKISDTEGGFTGILDDVDLFGRSVASLGDLDGDGLGDLAVGALGDDDGGTGRGAVWVLFLDGVPRSIPLPLDIKPGSCPNPFNRHGNGVLPMALIGTV